MTVKPDCLVVSSAAIADLADGMADRSDALFPGGLVSWGSHPDHGGLVLVELEGQPGLAFQMLGDS